MKDKSTELEGKVALITGASRRVGAHVAETLHASGMKVCIHYRSSHDEAAQLVEKLNAVRPNSATSLQADLLATDHLHELVSKAGDNWGRLDLLVNNASTFYPTPVESFTETDWDDLVGSNLKAPLFLCQAAAPLLAKSSGCIVNMIDIHAEKPKPGFLVYNLAKAGLLGMTKSLAVELAPDIRVNGIAPGVVMWPEGEASQDAAEREEMLKKIALNRPGEPADIAAAILFLVRDAPYITGHMLPVDGGRLLNM